MRNIKYIEQKLKSIVKKICDRDIDQIDTNIFIHPINISSRELAYIFLEIEKEFGIDLNSLVDEYKNHTLEGLIKAIDKIENVVECVNE